MHSCLQLVLLGFSIAASACARPGQQYHQLCQHMRVGSSLQQQ